MRGEGLEGRDSHFSPLASRPEPLARLYYFP
jgi:hypothetical protein